MADYYWKGGSGSNGWNTAANWVNSGGSAYGSPPSASDDVYFDDTGQTDCVLNNTNLTARYIYIQSNFSHLLTMSGLSAKIVMDGMQVSKAAVFSFTASTEFEIRSSGSGFTSYVNSSSTTSNNHYIRYLIDSSPFANDTSRLATTYDFNSKNYCLVDGVYPTIDRPGNLEAKAIFKDTSGGAFNSYGSVDLHNFTNNEFTSTSTNPDVYDYDKQFYFEGRYGSDHCFSYRIGENFKFGHTTVIFRAGTDSQGGHFQVPVKGDIISSGSPRGNTTTNVFNVQYHKVIIRAPPTLSQPRYCYIEDGRTLECNELVIEAGGRLYGPAEGEQVASSKIKSVKRPTVQGDWNFKQIADGIYESIDNIPTLPVTEGGTGLNTVDVGRIPFGNGQLPLQTLSTLNYNTGSNTLNAVNAHFTGKLTVDGLIDPTGMEFTAVSSNPGSDTAKTIWVNSGDSNKLYFGSSEVGGSSGISLNGSTANGILTFGNSTTADVEANITASGATLSINNPSGNGSIELGGSTGGFIDLKGPFSNDYDLRIRTTGSGGTISTASNQNIVLDPGSGNVLMNNGTLNLNNTIIEYGGGKQQTVDLATGWYTFAYVEGRDSSGTSGQRAFGEFLINDVDSGRHGSCRLNATHFFGSGNSIQVFAYNFYSTIVFNELRIKEHSTYSGAALQVYVSNANNNLETYMTMSEQNASWILLDTWLADSDTSGHDAILGYAAGSSSWTDFAAAETIDLSVFAATTQGGIYTSGGLKAETLFLGKTGTAGTYRLHPDATNSFISVDSTGEGVTLAADNDLTLHADDDLFFQAGGNTKAVLLNTGNFGIGTTNPQATLEVVDALAPTDPDQFTYAETLMLDVENGGSATGPAIRFRHGATNDHNGGDFVFQVNGDGGNFSAHEYSTNYGFNKWFHAANADGFKAIGRITRGGSTAAGQTLYGEIHLVSTSTAWDVYDGTHTGLHPTGYDLNLKLSAGEDSYFNGGNVGIGTSSPNEKLQVAGNVLVNNNGSVLANGSGYLKLGNTNSGHVHIHGDPGNSIVEGFGNHLVLQTVRDNDDIRFRVNAGGTESDGTQAEAVIIEGNTGRVGIGTTNPQGNLHVVGGTGDAGRIYLSDADNGTGTGDSLLITKSGDHAYIYNRDSGGDLSLGAGDNSGWVTIADDGKVGIGDTNPIGAKLHVEQANDTTVYANTNETYRYTMLLRNNTVATNAFSGIAFDVSTESDFDSLSASIAAVRDTSAGSTAANHDANLVFATNDAGDDGLTERMRITHDGNVGIGITDPSEKLEVAGSILMEYALAHSGESGSNRIIFTTATQSFQTGGADRLDITNSGVRLGGANSRVTTILDEDNMASNSATALATQQSIKAYVDSQSGGGGSPAGSDGQIQYNNGGSFGGDADFVWDDSNNRLVIGSVTSQHDGLGKLTVKGTDASLLLERHDESSNGGPTLTLYRYAATEEDGDLLGQISFRGEDSAGSPVTYCSIRSQIVDDTSSTKDGRLIFRGLVNNSQTDFVDIDSTGLTLNQGTFNGNMGTSSYKPAVFMDTGTQNVNQTEATIGFNSEVLDPAGNATLATGLGEDGHIRLVAGGYYRISYSIPINDDGSSLADRTRVFCFMQTSSSSTFSSSTTVAQSRCQVYTRESSGGSGLSTSFIYQHTANNYIRLRIDAQNNTDISTESNQAQISIEYLGPA